MPIEYAVVLSTKRTTDPLALGFTLSLASIRNIKGSKIDPGGTPLLIAMTDIVYSNSISVFYQRDLFYPVHVSGTTSIRV